MLFDRVRVPAGCRHRRVQRHAGHTADTEMRRVLRRRRIETEMRRDGVSLRWRHLIEMAPYPAHDAMLCLMPWQRVMLPWHQGDASCSCVMKGRRLAVASMATRRARLRPSAAP